MKEWKDFNISIPTGAPGPEVYTQCPECSPHRKKKNVKCLSVNIEKLVWHCAHCAWSGTLKDGVKDRSNPYEWKKREYRKPQMKLTDLPEKVVTWFTSRKISEYVLKRNRIGYESVYMPQEEEFVSAIRFPYYRNGELVNIKSRDGKKNFRMESGAERIFFGMDDMKEAKQAIIVEGEIDKLSIEMAGFENCISVPDGAPSPKAKDYTSKFDFLDGCMELMAHVETFILAVDNDEPGRVLEEELSRRIGRERCKRVEWPEGCKDANDVLKDHGPNVLRECIQEAAYYPIEGTFSVNDLWKNTLKLYEEGVSSGQKIGLGNFDDFYSVRTGEWTLVSGIPGHGKSEFLDMILLSLAYSGWRHAIFSPENQPLERHIAKLAEKATGKPFFNNPFKPRMTYEELFKCLGPLNQNFTFILPPEDKLTVESILETAKAVVKRQGIKGLVIDPWNELDHSRPNSMTETEYISHCLSKIRRFARQYGVHVWLVAHPQKLRRNADDTYPVPTPYDVSGSAHWRNKADNCLTVYRNFETNDVDIHIQKIRFKEIGKVGMVSMKYDHFSGRYTPCGQ